MSSPQQSLSDTVLPESNEQSQQTYIYSCTCEIFGGRDVWFLLLFCSLEHFMYSFKSLSEEELGASQFKAVHMQRLYLAMCVM